MKIKQSKIHFGAAYYPEHWPEDRWETDVHLMAAAGFTVARMGEFAWSTFEPSEGSFHFEWLERAIALLAENGIKSVLGTPTAAPPAWLTQQYPDTLAVDENGLRKKHGKRCHYCVNSQEFQQHTRRIVDKFGKCFGSNPLIIGWQLDNEYGTICYCDTCRDAFRAYLQGKFGSLDKLNASWTTAYWSQTYTSWDQIPIPKSGHNPGLMLAFQQFITHSYRKFQKIQLEELRPHLPENVWVTHNFMNWHPTFDHYELTADLDLASWDWYVGTGHNDYTESGAAHDLVRGFKRKNFWLMETQPGNVNWTPVNNPVSKGEARAMAWHAVGHGADAVLYWQWRSALNGQEQFHGTLVDQSGGPRPFYAEAAILGKEFAKVSDLLAGSEVKAKVALLNDYDSRWSLDWQRHHKDFDYVKHLKHYYRYFSSNNIPVDIISADESLDGYWLVIAPALTVLKEAQSERLENFTSRGGTLVLTIRTGVKDEFNSLLPSRPPGSLSKLANAEVEEYYALETAVTVRGNLLNGVSRLWGERLKIVNGEKIMQPVARYRQEKGWLDDQVAISATPYQRGFVYYVGAYLDDTSQSKFLEQVCKIARVKPLIETPRGVEACRRVTPDDQEVFILINHEISPKKISIPWEAHEHLSGNTGSGELTLAPFGVAVLTKIVPEEDSRGEGRE
jgi:beta-galactosidase